MTRAGERRRRRRARRRYLAGGLVAVGVHTFKTGDVPKIENLVGTTLEHMSDEQITKALAVLGMEHTRRTATEVEEVSVDNFVIAETARMFDGMLLNAGGVNQWFHNREPVALDAQNVIRMNRDTLYSGAIVDITEGATLTLPDAGDRYLSLMVLNEGHYINAIWHDAGTYELTVDEFDTDHVALVLRVFVDPDDPDDLAAVHALQDAVNVEAASASPYQHPVYDEASRKKTHELLLELSAGIPDGRGSFGSIDEIDPIRHLCGAASGWGGLPEHEAYYIIETEPRDVGRYTVTIEDVPVDGFWSFSIYNRDGFFEENKYNAYSANNVTAIADDDGSVTLHLAPDDEAGPNHLYVMDGWNYAFRIYRPRPEVIDGTWQLAPPQPAT